MAMQSVIRAIGSDQVRDLARQAIGQGWDVYSTGGGHLAVVHPATGAQVTLSRNAGGGHAIANVRQAFARAGLDLRSKSERRRAHRQEVRAMQARDVTETPTPPPTVVAKPEAPAPVHLTTPHLFEPGDDTARDARGHVLRLCRLCGKAGQSPLHRPARIAEAERPKVAVSERLVAYQAPAPAAPETPKAKGNGAAHSSYHVVSATPEEFPLAAHLAALDASVAPAIVALEEAGKTDAAALLSAELERSPLEEELVALYRRVMAGD
jgi:hypothetical protein